MKLSVEKAKDILMSEFKENSYVKDAPFGNANTSKKIYTYITVCVLVIVKNGLFLYLKKWMSTMLIS